MKKIVVMLLVLLLLSLLGAQGCPKVEDIKGRIPGRGEEVVRLRGLSIDFEKGKPHLSSVEGEKLPVIRSGKDFDVALRVTNYLLKSVSGSITIYNLARYAGDVRSERSFSVEGAVLQDDKIYPGVNVVDFGSFVYDKGDVEDSLITEIEIDYDAMVNADLCFSKDAEQVVGVICNNDETIMESSMKGDAGYLPVSIEKIKKEVNVRDENAEFYLTIYFKNFGNGLIDNNKLERFDVNMIGYPIDCGDSVMFRDGKANIECSGEISFGEELFVKVPVEFDFDYGYKVIKTINYKVL